ncbi:MAG: chromosomal replication initiator protein DnaA, partial [Candidatus Marinamargulisbacteria bacterium]
LLHGIANEISKKNLNVCLITSEKFTNDLINSLKNRSTSEFKTKYRRIDVLLIDDVQFLSGKESTQEEFFHTFNELHGQNKQIVMTSDSPPNEIPTLQDRLKTRFSWGLTADIQPPELETRIAILRTKLEQANTTISDDVLNYVATQFPNNVRELEGALNRITAYANLLESNVNISSASKIIKDLINEQNKKPLTIPQIKRMVSAKLGIAVEQLSSKSRTKDISMARQIAMYLCREVTNISLLKIGENFGNRDHTTVIHAIDKIKQLLVTDSDVKTIVDDLKKEARKQCE